MDKGYDLIFEFTDSLVYAWTMLEGKTLFLYYIHGFALEKGLFAGVEELQQVLLGELRFPVTVKIPALWEICCTMKQE